MWTYQENANLVRRRNETRHSRLLMLLQCQAVNRKQPLCRLVSACVLKVTCRRMGQLAGPRLSSSEEHPDQVCAPVVNGKWTGRSHRDQETSGYVSVSLFFLPADCRWDNVMAVCLSFPGVKDCPLQGDRRESWCFPFRVGIHLLWITLFFNCHMSTSKVWRGHILSIAFNSLMLHLLLMFCCET